MVRGQVYREASSQAQLHHKMVGDGILSQRRIWMEEKDMHQSIICTVQRLGTYERIQ
jgi:hypothetical protein